MLDEIKKNVFDPHAAPGNWVLYNLYDELPLPQAGFSECTRIKWNVKGELKEGEETYALSNRRTVDDIVIKASTFAEKLTEPYIAPTDCPALFVRASQHLQQEQSRTGWQARASA